MKKLLQRLLPIVAALVCSTSQATYNANTGNVIVTYVGVYADGDYIYFAVNSPPAHGACGNGYFVIPEEVPQNRRNQMLPLLLAAKHSGSSITVGYDGTGSCVHGYIRAHRVG